MSTSGMVGGCGCEQVRYELLDKPLFTHCCHCRWCQRETGTAFAINAMIEAKKVRLHRGRPEMILTPSLSGNGQKIWRCPHCQIALWSNYSGAGDLIHFVRVGTLDDPDQGPPDIHIFTASKQPWVVIPLGVPVVEQFYDPREYWSSDSLERRAAVQHVWSSR